MALENEITSISFPSISTGVYRCPVEEAAKIAIKEILTFLKEHTEIELLFT